MAELTDKQKEKERIEAIEAEEQAALLSAPKIDEDDEDGLICRIFINESEGRRLYIPGNPEFPGPPKVATK